MSFLESLPRYDHKFGKSSRANLAGVMPELVEVAELAITICKWDATVVASGGLRTVAEAEANHASGTGIKDSRHIRQADGFGHAIDLVLYLPGIGPTWDRKHAPKYADLAKAVKIAAAYLCVPIRQGCDWNMNGKFGESREWDWPHFEDPIEYWRPRAVAEMHRFRGELGLEPVVV